jgi:hypothetical protein
MFLILWGKEVSNQLDTLVALTLATVFGIYLVGSWFDLIALLDVVENREYASCAKY